MRLVLGRVGGEGRGSQQSSVYGEAPPPPAPRSNPLPVYIPFLIEKVPLLSNGTPFTYLEDKLNSARLIVICENQLSRHQHDTDRTQNRARLKPSTANSPLLWLVRAAQQPTEHNLCSENTRSLCFKNPNIESQPTDSRHITCLRKGKSPSVALMSRQNSLPYKCE